MGSNRVTELLLFPPPLNDVVNSIPVVAEIELDNSLQCAYCQDSQCNSLMQCRGLQDRCFNSTG